MRGLRAPVTVGLVVAALCLPTSEAVSDSNKGQVKIENVDVRISEHGPVVLLSAESKTIPIFVDQTVATSIHGVLTGFKTRRPLSHDLMRAILEGFEGKVTKTEITLKEGIYYGTLSITVGDQEKVFDSRSSDAIALAIHFKAPIMVGRDLLDSAGKADVFERTPPTETL